jgi:hypothetical protein
MKNNSILLLLAIAGICIVSSCKKDATIELFNGKNLKNWIVVAPDSVPADSVFWVANGLMHTSGIPKGYIRTRKSYDNYTLHAEWRWTGEPGNSGVLLHATGEDIVFPNSIEAQLKAGNAGDLVLIGEGSGITVSDSVYLVTSEENRYKVIKKFQESSEYEPGEWNSYDILVRDDMVTLTVNGVLQNKGTSATITRGSICLQSEGVPMQFRNVYLVPLE